MLIMSNNEFKRYEYCNYIKSKYIKILSLLEKHGFSEAVDKMAIRSKYCNQRVLNDIETNDFITTRINDNCGFMAARFGAVELNYIYYYLRKQLGYNDLVQRKEALRMLCYNAGFFPHDYSLADKLAGLYLDSVNEMDLCGVWNIFMEDYILHKYSQNCTVTKLRTLEPWITQGKKPWTKALSGKKVLIIHPFAESMRKQYEKRKNLFTKRFGEDDILPPMDIEFVKAVQSIGGCGAEGYSDWFEAYDYMLNKIVKKNFDVAVLGCGAYGFPLAAEIKRFGKKSIHLGGATQLWFGIKGKRWNNDPLVNVFYNDYWINPSDSEKPVHADGVEGGCYW